MKIGFSGTRQGMTSKQHEALEWYFNCFEVTEFHHGDCIGADLQAHVLAHKKGIKCVVHPPNIDKLRAFVKLKPNDEIREPKPYLTRNKMIVDETELLIVAPKTEDVEVRSGTWSTARYAARKNCKIIYVCRPFKGGLERYHGG